MRTRRHLLLLAVVAAVVVAVPLAVLAAPTRSTVGPHAERWFGEDRIETSVAISQQVWTDRNTTTVFIATATNFPDALALGASTGGEGPILLVTRDELPSVVAAEIRRLQPCRIVAAGGPVAIADAVILAAETQTDRVGCP